MSQSHTHTNILFIDIAIHLPECWLLSQAGLSDKYFDRDVFCHVSHRYISTLGGGGLEAKCLYCLFKGSKFLFTSK